MDKFTEAKIQRQAANLRMLDSGGSPVLVHATTGVIKTYPDPVPEYTAATTQGQTANTTHGRHEADGRGVTAHVVECLRDDFGLTDADIGRQVSSSSSDCEAVYSGPSNRFRRIWTEKFGRPLVHLDDRDHRLETMLNKISKEDEGSWLSDYLDKLKQVIGVFQHSAMLKRQLRKAAEQLEQVAVALQRLIDTQFVEYMVEAVSRVLKNRAAIVNVLHELLALGSICSAGAHDALRTLESPAFIMDSPTIIDVMTPAVTMSKCGQKDIYSIFEDRRTVKTYLDTIDRMATGAFRGLVEEEGPQVAAGMHRGSQVGVTTRYPTRTPTSNTDPDDSVTDASKRRQGLAQAILRQYLGTTSTEQLALDAFDFRRSGAEPEQLDISVTPCSVTCRGARCACLRQQYRTFRTRVAERTAEFEDRWLPLGANGTRAWRPEAVLSALMQPTLGLHEDLPDLAEIGEIVLLMCRSQSDTERVGKTAKRVSEGRFEGKFDERKDDQKDRLKKEVFF